MFVDQGAAGYLGRVRGQHQFDRELSYGSLDLVFADPFGFQMIEQGIEGIRTENIGFTVT